ncbi:hypothetical protein EVAR_85286_1 [Eumeta japonica]|uniref:Reverse transcriptase domain-containing protein n=1 Tax=Eumeta variegata TaxID=151549 RepID=A0A4C1V7W1_EUMVA|nr:hypothetical protein EVAR_85286_1 [Eumeta japonica]
MDDSVALDNVEIGECLADSIESQCSHISPPHDIAHIQHIEEEVQNKASLEPKNDLPPVSLSEVQTLVKSLKTKRHQASKIVLFISSIVITEIGILLLDTSALTRLDDVSEQEFLMALPLFPLLYSAYTNDIACPSSGVQLALFADDIALYFRARLKKSILLLQRAIDELSRWFRT